jgi:hypothetical protein
MEDDIMEKVTNLMEILGGTKSKAEVIRALEAVGGNSERAIEILMDEP